MEAELNSVREEAKNNAGAYAQLASLISKGHVRQDNETGDCFVPSALEDEK